MSSFTKELSDYLRRAPKGLLLEGKTDAQALFALLGVERPSDGVYQGVVVVGLDDRDGSGSRAVRRRIEHAQQTAGLQDRFIGIIDSDGVSQEGCLPAFEERSVGTLLVWPTYCIENLLAQTGWPAAFPGNVDLPEQMARYAGYVALHRMVQELRPILEALRLHRREQPYRDPFLTPEEIERVLRRDQGLITEYPIAERFRHEVDTFCRLTREDLAAAHQAFDGKWLVEHLAVRLCEGKSKDECRAAWLAHARATGGHPQVRDLWRRIAGRLPS